MIYSIGDCPVCGDFSRVIFARNRRTHKLFVFCGACEIAWLHPSEADRFDSLLACKDVAPEGIDLPTKSEIAAAGFEPFIRDEYNDEEWWIDLAQFT